MAGPSLGSSSHFVYNSSSSSSRYAFPALLRACCPRWFCFAAVERGLCMPSLFLAAAAVVVLISLTVSAYCCRPSSPPTPTTSSSAARSRSLARTPTVSPGKRFAYGEGGGASHPNRVNAAMLAAVLARWCAVIKLHAVAALPIFLVRVHVVYCGT